MKILFAGTPIFAATALDAMLAASFPVDLVLTQPDRAAGRGLKMQASAVKQLAQQHNLPLLQPLSLKSAELEAQLHAATPDVMIVAAYGLILPATLLQIPRYGCINIHASLLPRWRGAAPIQRAILAGDQETGITIMQMDNGLDTGAILSRHPISIAPNETTATLHDKLAILGGTSIVATLQDLVGGKLTLTPQAETSASYAAKISKSEAAIDWTLNASHIERKIRAFNPYPGAFSSLAGNPIKIWQTSVVDPDSFSGMPGKIIHVASDGIAVACGHGTLRIEILQPAGGKKLTAAQFMAGHAFSIGDRFVSADKQV
ncbi:methionyl-tRNA formyltransferase [Nitrosomonas mobilis]|uniref:Methionyl-tRNA formyltransferase n=1 Tax=Nitrosomonas mobilis TaxID=51642 RepID=A0A1G5SGF1_9PROT|nr:methionyl-tRNA formyltransferase [Nitrosomonas mobilis]SCZ86264.1 10-formyltetrahydrofolate:L-methionyl-tRNA(fMet) N-formyltransferase [Nitrosomonas mobilis]